MIKYFKIIQDIWNTRKRLDLFFAWILLRLKKFFKIGFMDINEKIKLKKIDIVIPTILKDYLLLDKYLESLKNLDHNINKIFIVSSHNEEILDFCKTNNLFFIDEKSVLGYNKKSIKYISNGIDRSGWIFQQLLKLSGDKFVEMDNYIIIDSDTILINKTSFLQNEKFVFFENEEWHQPYFKVFETMFGYKAKTKLSFTSHMMIFNVYNLKLMKAELENKHKINWDKVYLSSINKKEVSCVSDYETYANWVLYHYPEKVITKPLYNRTLSRKELNNLKKYKNKFKSVSFHSYAKQ